MRTKRHHVQWRQTNTSSHCPARHKIRILGKYRVPEAGLDDSIFMLCTPYVCTIADSTSQLLRHCRRAVRALADKRSPWPTTFAMELAHWYCLIKSRRIRRLRMSAQNTSMALRCIRLERVLSSWRHVLNLYLNGGVSCAIFKAMSQFERFLPSASTAMKQPALASSFSQS